MIGANQPIGVFDSGVGGLTVANAINYLLPNEEIIYFGDTAHLPYGDKSLETIQYYSKHIAEYLLRKNCKIILIACNTASANAFDAIKTYVGNQAITIDVITPVVEYFRKNNTNGSIGVIGTKSTINSGTYEKRIQNLNLDVPVVSLATPLFVPMIEEGFIYDDISNAIIRAYLSNEKLKKISHLILGCTHYPVIKNQIRKFFEFNVEIIDSSLIVAKYLRNVLSQNKLFNTSETPKKNSFFVSDYTDYFNKIATMFFEESIPLQKINIWQN